MGDRRFIAVLLERVVQSSDRELSLLLELSERCIKLVVTATLDALRQVWRQLCYITLYFNCLATTCLAEKNP
jgi:hypothetical protein